AALRSQARVTKPLRARCPMIGVPIRPAPTTPTALTAVFVILHSYGFQRFCVMVSRRAGWPAFTLAIARLSAAATSFGLSLGPSAYHPMDFAIDAKSGSG